MSDYIWLSVSGFLVAIIAVLSVIVWRQRGMLAIRRYAFAAVPRPRQIVDPEGKNLFANPAFEDFFGGDLRAVPDLILDESQGDEDIGRKLATLQLNARNGVSGHVEIELPRSGPSDRDTQWRHVAAYPIPNRPGYVFWFVDDITMRRQMEQVINDQQQRFVDLLENAPIGFFSVDDKGCFLFANQTLTDWLGYSSSELESGKIKLHDIIADASLEDVPPYHPFEDAESSAGEVFLKTGDGEKRVLAAISQHIADGGAEKGFRTRSVVRNLTLEREMATALEQSEKRFRKFFNEAPVGIVLLNERGVITECNRAFLEFLETEESAKGKPLLSLVGEEERDQVRTALVSASTFERKALEVRLEGNPNRVCSMNVTHVDENSGLPSGYILNFTDTTDQRNLEAQFAQSQKMQAVGQLAGGIAHDFNNLLTAMIGFSDLLLLRHRPGDQSFADIMQIKQNANRAANLVRQLLAFSRQQTLQPRRLNVTDIIAELAHLLRRLIGENIELRITHGRDLGDVKADQGQLEQVIINLAVNARDAMDHGGVLEIITSNVIVENPYKVKGEEIPPGDYVLVKVQDTGHGIPTEIIDRIFDPFFSTKEVGAGTGLGLSTVYGIVKQSGGFVFVDSAADEGTVFSLLFPHFREGKKHLEEVATEAPQALDLTGRGTILLVEDEDAVRSFSARALENKGYKVHEANSGEAALEVLKSEGAGVDLIITDVVMPRMDGPTLIKHALEMRPDMKVIFISGYTEDSFRKSLDDNSAIEFLPKPFSLKQLATKVKEVLGA
ncbi:PAS domain S-box protein [Kiloniella laminariae]|uniref:histidine kinase n=1 Tax=Kiloniella laminariae TaxID=454162 RepID=A0ABT4LJD2_9PROT|nr:PAS domain-containing sensor histidine kinase [Kiloniella laminariae]MCZ4280471.1 PAS domain S-box protein [Kiloniella laminariae]